MAFDGIAGAGFKYAGLMTTDKGLLIKRFNEFMITEVGWSQDYQIDFTASGESTSVCSIEVTNLNQNTRVTLGGEDILVLSNITSVNEKLTFKNQDLRLYPNPSAEIVTMDFYNRNEGLVKSVLG